MNTLIQVRVGDFALNMAMDLDPSIASDYAIMQFTEFWGCPEPETVHAMQHILRKDDVAIDGGANVGYFSLVMAAIVGPQGKVFAAEPEWDNIKKLKRNLSLNDAKQVEIIDEPLWNKQEKVILHMAKTNGEHSLKAHDTFPGSYMIATTIDSLNVRPRLIKLDIEGAEIQALQGAIDTILTWRPYIICEMNHQALERFGGGNYAFRDYVRKQFGYDTYLLLKTHLYPVLLPHGVTIMSQIQNMNVLLATQQMVAEAFPHLYYVLPQNVLS